ncbi:DUF2203 domain-containing protein [Sphaerisporangium sp. TRM90804]|uniref:DUF2203 domain-containing protein n=1 Tax=Sphaerisporangium sp. TRM90804 TaxID=3031113 RepID=UPI0024490386|nr:DUF2203 domain-containing protein [Sphaerisporangium sp. TRM90804]MDH2426842.1 DUF2203 domain-containing protein [Sphaerisporangium sp. TRM90804]
MDRIWTAEEARSLMPQVRRLVDEIIAIRADLAELGHDLRGGGRSPLGGLAEAKAMEARVAEVLGWFDERQIEIKGIAPVLVDFPAVLDGVSVRLCWIEGETDLGWYHRTDLGFPGRRRLL